MPPSRTQMLPEAAVSQQLAEDDNLLDRSNIEEHLLPVLLVGLGSSEEAVTESIKDRGFKSY